ncbi:hypothetical protein FTO70_11875 [Methanosarcina sp. KYL-1]|uniref:hypothetical protein n=1 Tax=Methanosarcina sp. KYL-1 TaxID=2602068 RepID=UPI002100B470|nr:hypothetical protein [Methanosarcina sp. KYL-1]MCQ1536364.1 hypothetical protein [Methanosarcina sp. KYL-1]
MKIKAVITIAIIISASLMAARFTPGIDMEQFREGKYIHLDQVVIEFDRSDAEINIHYHLSPFAQVYMFLFGSRHMEPKIEEIFFDFKEVDIQKIGRTNARIQVKGVSRQNDDYYLHDSREFGMRPDTLTLVYPDGTIRNIEKARATPDTFYAYT